MDIIQTKVVVALLFGIIRFVSGILPMYIFSWFKIEKEVNGKKVIDEKRRNLLDFGVVLVQSFGGGVLFATCFLHMMPEVYYSVEELKHFGVLKRNYPYSQLVISTGFFTVYFIEEIGQWIVTLIPKEPWAMPSSRSSRTSSTMRITPKDNKVKPEIINTRNNISMFVDEDEKKEKDVKDFEDDLSVDVAVDEEVQTEDEKCRKMSLTDQTDFEKEKELELLMEKKVPTQQQLLRCIFIVLALSFHAVLEGLAIGLQHSTANIWYLFTAVSIHSATILFCVSLEIYLSGSKQKIILINTVILSLGSPIGVLIGLTVSLTTDMHTQAKSLAVVHLEGLSAGTILYITFFEVLSREKERRMCRVKRAIFIIGGFVMMAGLECLKVS